MFYPHYWCNGEETEIFLVLSYPWWYILRTKNILRSLPYFIEKWRCIPPLFYEDYFMSSLLFSGLPASHWKQAVPHPIISTIGAWYSIASFFGGGQGDYWNAPRYTLPLSYTHSSCYLFWDMVLLCCWDRPWICNPLASATRISKIIGEHHCTHLSIRCLKIWARPCGTGL